MEVALSKTDANPFRNIENYPIHEDKIAALRESLQTTGFWDNLVGRKASNGHVEIAYGHHRLEALRREYGPDTTIDITVRTFSDDSMLKIMARENMEEWGTSALIEHETVRAVVEAYGAGKIELPDPRRPGVNSAYIRWAPSFVAGGEPGGPGRQAPYTLKTVAEFLGWTTPSGAPQEKIENALAALAYIEQGHLSEPDFDGLTTKQAEALIEETRRSVIAAERAEAEEKRRAAEAERQRQQARERAARAEKEQAQAAKRAQAAKDKAAKDKAERDHQKRQEAARQAAQAREEADQRAQAQQKEAKRAANVREAERKKVTQAVGQDLRSGGGYKNARAVADQVRTKSRGDAAPPQIDDYAKRTAGKIHRILDEEYDKLAGEVSELIRYRKHLSPGAAQNLARELSALAARATSLRDRLTHDQAASDADGSDLDVIDAEVIDDTVTS